MNEKYAILNQESKLRTSWPVLNQADDFCEDFLSARLKNSNTPDIPALELKNGHLLFVYGSLKSGFSRHYLLSAEGAEFVAVATSNLIYSLYYQANTLNERFPVMLPAQDTSGFIVGQLFLARPRTIRMIDDFERNGRLFKRIKCGVQIVSKPKNSNYQRYAMVYAWCYIGINDVWREKVLSGEMLPVEKSALFKEDDRNCYIHWQKSHCYLDKTE